MALSNIQKERISIEVINTLVSRFENFPANSIHNRNAPFHKAFLNAFANKLEGYVSNVPFFISLASWLHGLNTTLGQTFFENTARILCNGEKREYTSKKLGNLQITETQQNVISTIITDLGNSSIKPNLIREDQQVMLHDNSALIKADDFSADVFFEYDDTITAIELKAVKPNSGEIKGEKRKILIGKAALYNEFPNKRVNFYFGFPFDPTVDTETEKNTSFNKVRFFNSVINMDKFCDQKEVLIADELWDFLSGEKNTMAEILAIINTIATTSFQSKFKLIQTDMPNRNISEYSKQLKEWNLFSELDLINNNDTIRKRLDSVPNSRLLKSAYNNLPFNENGNYNWRRYLTLKELIA